MSIRDGVKLAVAEINAKGGIGGRKIELVERDDESKPSMLLKETTAGGCPPWAA